ncbi:MAG: lysophospholipid acyltransferase family protein [Eubacteriales bacterium]|jgi:1-acyl-sn-glycerol-3-phosphate acyltransferase
MDNAKEKINIFYIVSRFIARVLLFLLFSIRITGRENVPKTGSLIVCANHTSPLDPVLLGAKSNRVICFMAKEELMKTRFTKWLFKKYYVIPAKRDGSDAMAVKTALRLLKNGKVLGIFPEGTTKKDDKELLDGKPGALLLSLQTKTPIVPIAICGRYCFRKKVYVHIGKPLQLYEQYREKKYKSEELTEITNRTIMAELKTLLEACKKEVENG